MGDDKVQNVKDQHNLVLPISRVAIRCWQLQVCLHCPLDYLVLPAMLHRHLHNRIWRRAAVAGDEGAASKSHCKAWQYNRERRTQIRSPQTRNRPLTPRSQCPHWFNDVRPKTQCWLIDSFVGRRGAARSRPSALSSRRSTCADEDGAEMI
ncbi:uncharacterized protein LOC123518195 [Portunus trituberculatus]|uniref:uncharacterized protein LOC123518195 n=1 Tax=Portunus trituberculatus TaxID=210409 RepID=UPI001E1CFE88|nr:uncharacterized protein LOC123518195 [Portunus trituberculatus]